MFIETETRIGGRRFGWDCASILLIFALSAHPAAASQNSCQHSSILFFFGRGLYSTLSSGRAHQVASGFRLPKDLQWSPGCQYYTFVANGSFWIGKPDARPREVILPRPEDVIESLERPVYFWNHKGTEVALTVGDSASRKSGVKTKTSSGYGDVVLIQSSDLAARRVTNDHLSYALGWTNDDLQVVVGRKAIRKVPCAPALVACPRDDLFAINVSDGSAALLLTANQQIQYGPVDSFIAWRPKEHLLVTRQVSLLEGGQGIVAARNLLNRRIIWEHECRKAEYLGYGLVGILEGIWNPDSKRLQTRMTVLNPNGGVFERVPLIPQNPTQVPINWSRDLGYVAWWRGENSTGLAYGISFASLAQRNVWTYLIPHGAWPIDIEWTPHDNLIVATKEGIPEKLMLRLLDYRTRKSHLLFEIRALRKERTTSDVPGILGTK